MRLFWSADPGKAVFSSYAALSSSNPRRTFSPTDRCFFHGPRSFSPFQNIALCFKVPDSHPPHPFGDVYSSVCASSQRMPDPAFLLLDCRFPPFCSIPFGCARPFPFSRHSSGHPPSFSGSSPRLTRVALPFRQDFGFRPVEDSPAFFVFLLLDDFESLIGFFLPPSRLPWAKPFLIFLQTDPRPKRPVSPLESSFPRAFTELLLFWEKDFVFFCRAGMETSTPLDFCRRSGIFFP